MANGKLTQAKIREFAKQERANLIERRNAILRELQDAFNKEIGRLDDFEERLAKEDIAVPLPAPDEFAPDLPEKERPGK